MTANLIQRNQLRGAATHKFVVLLTTAAAGLLIEHSSRATGPSKGQNREAFGFLCSAVLAEGNLKSRQKALTEAGQIAAKAHQLATYTLSPQSIEAQAAAENPEDATKIPDSKLSEECRGDKRPACVDAAKHFQDFPDSEKVKLRAATKADNHLRLKISATLTRMTAITKEEKLQGDALAEQSEAEAALKKAIYGLNGSPANFALSTTGSSRTEHCGSAPSTPATSAANSIAETLLCLCANGASGEAGNTACFTAATTAQTFGNNQNAKTVWEEIKAKCKSDSPANAATTAADLRWIIRGLETMLHTSRADDHKIGFIGTPSTGGTAGACSGDDTGGTGACSFFSSDGNTVVPPKWLTELKAAVSSQEQLEQAPRSSVVAEAELRSLNESLTTLLQLTALANSQQTQKAPGTAVAAENNKQKEEEAEEECNKKDKETDYTANTKCKWNGETKPPKKVHIEYDSSEQTSNPSNTWRRDTNFFRLQRQTTERLQQVLKMEW